MVIYKMKEEKREVQIAKIEAMYEGRGKAKGRKMSVILSHFVQGKEVQERVDFWNSTNKMKPQLADRIRKMEVGEYIVVIVSKKDDDFTALDFKSEEGIFSFHENKSGEINVFIGRILSSNEENVFVEKENRNHSILQIKTGKNNVVFWDRVFKNRSCFDEIKTTSANIMENGELAVLVCGRGEKDYSIGYRIYELPKKGINEETPFNNFQITLGPYKKNPVFLEHILDISDENKKENLILWLKYIAEEWVAKTDSEKEQKNKIRSYLELAGI